MPEWGVLMENVKGYLGYGVLIITIASCFIEVSKIKINPLSFLFSRIGAAFNKPTLDRLEAQQKQLNEFNEKIDEISKAQAHMDKKIDTNEVKRIRAEIMAFATSCKKREDHNEQQYQNIMKLHDEYNKLVSEIGITNGVLDEDYAFIMKVYGNCRDSGKFYEGHCYQCKKEEVK